jgi:hypothetical protein
MPTHNNPPKYYHVIEYGSWRLVQDPTSVLKKQVPKARLYPMRALRRQIPFNKKTLSQFPNRDTLHSTTTHA